ncbi:MAG: hypothetical protein M1820_007213 [Bogoriella megaspora]|nr:MAG: hypothetical protein M1820_007213 [Bogoriella megaspora]
MLQQISVKALAALVMFLVGNVGAHTWNEQLQAIDKNGNYVGDYGYPRGYFDKHGMPGSQESQIVYQIPQDPKAYLDNTDFACHPNQRTQNQTQNFPRLKVNPGGYVAMKYLENGHVTQPWVNQGKPDKTGTVFVYGTTQPKNDEKLIDVLQWNKNGTGGDKRGVLLTAQDFDDGRCHQVNPGSCIAAQRMQSDSDNKMEQWCETDLHVPTSYKAGTTLSIYWIWQWSTSVNFENGKDQFYSTCSDFDIVADPPKDTKPTHTIAQQDPQTKAAENWSSRTAVNDRVHVLEWDMEKNQKAVATPMIKVKAPMSVIPVNVLSASACSALSAAPASSPAPGASASVADVKAAPTSTNSSPASLPSAAAGSPTVGTSSMVFTAPSVSGMAASGVTTILVTSYTTITPGAPTNAAGSSISYSSTSTIHHTTIVTVTKGNAKRSLAPTSKLPTDPHSFTYMYADLIGPASASTESLPKPTLALPADPNDFNYEDPDPSYKHAYAHAGAYGSTFGKRHGARHLRERRVDTEPMSEETFKALEANGILKKRTDAANLNEETLEELYKAGNMGW